MNARLMGGQPVFRILRKYRYELRSHYLAVNTRHEPEPPRLLGNRQDGAHRLHHVSCRKLAQRVFHRRQQLFPREKSLYFRFAKNKFHVSERIVTREKDAKRRSPPHC